MTPHWLSPLCMYCLTNGSSSGCMHHQEATACHRASAFCLPNLNKDQLYSVEQIAEPCKHLQAFRPYLHLGKHYV